MIQSYRRRVIRRASVVFLSLGALALMTWGSYQWQYSKELEWAARWCSRPVMESCAQFDTAGVWMMTVLYVFITVAVLLITLLIVGALATYILGPDACRTRACPCADHRRSNISDNSNVVVASLASLAAIIAITNM